MNLGAVYEKDISFERYLMEELLNHIGAQKRNIVMPKAIKGDAVGSCLAYEKHIKDRGGIDMQVLGIGINGHIGLNEPGSSFDSRTRIVKLDEQTINRNFERFGKRAGLSLDDMPKYAVAAGIETILEAKNIMLLACGIEKSEILNRALNGAPSISLPASALQAVKNKLTLISDKAATGRIGDLKAEEL